MPFQIASVPFLNAKPLVWALEKMGADSPVQVSYNLPSRLPAVLDSGQADAVLVSSIDALTVAGRRIAAGCSISSRGRVMSVRMFSKVPFSSVSTLALDSSSMTSNALARLVLREMYSCEPESTCEPPEGEVMLADHDACVLIGDKGLLFEGAGLYQLDLGEAWLDLTGLPFVWACWVGRDDLSPELVTHLIAARETGEERLASVAASAPPEIPQQLAHEYLTTVFDYGLDDSRMAALAKFSEMLDRAGVAPNAKVPPVVRPAVVSTVSPPRASLA